MGEVEPFTPDAIERHLNRSDVRYLRDEEGRFLAIYQPRAGQSADLQVWYQAEREVYSLRVTTTRYYRTEAVPSLLPLLNRWNCEMRWPKVFLAPAAEQSLVQLFAECQLDLSCGLHPEAFDHFTFTIVASADTFFNWIASECDGEPGGVIDIAELESWLRDAS